MKKLIILLCLAILFIGCKKKTDLSESYIEANVEAEYSLGGFGPYVKELRLKDNTKCVAIISGSNAISIACNWK